MRLHQLISEYLLDCAMRVSWGLRLSRLELRKRRQNVLRDRGDYAAFEFVMAQACAVNGIGPLLDSAQDNQPALW